MILIIYPVHCQDGGKLVQEGLMRMISDAPADTLRREFGADIRFHGERNKMIAAVIVFDETQPNPIQTASYNIYRA